MPRQIARGGKDIEMLLFVLLLETVLLGVAAFWVAACAQGSAQVSDWTLRYRYPRKR